MAAYGITASIFSIIIGYLAKLKYSRIVCMLISSVLSYAILTVMLLWNPNASQAYIFYILACISGLTTAIIKPFTTGLTFLKMKWFYIYIYLFFSFIWLYICGYERNILLCVYTYPKCWWIGCLSMFVSSACSYINYSANRLSNFGHNMLHSY